MTPVLGRRVGSASTDLGIVGIADHAELMSAWERDAAAYKASVSNEIPESGPCKVAKLGADPGAEVPFVESGFGDGRFSIYALEQDGKRIGTEVVFIRPEKPYPFL
jgi:hypothetical protein